MTQVEGMFDVPPSKRSKEHWAFDVPLEESDDWQIGLITGPSGSGKSSVALELFGEELICATRKWPKTRAVADAVAPKKPIKEVIAAMSAVGFSSPPAWLRPYGVLSTGEKFRIDLARTLLDDRELVVIDEFTSVVDRRVAKIASAALAKAVRRSGRKVVAVSCHEDVTDWLDPDWILEMPTGAFHWRSLRGRPRITIDIERCGREEWERFYRHHYLSAQLSVASKCFLARVDGTPAAFTGVLHFPHPIRPGWREHRTVCLPDFQGVGIGNAMSDFIAGVFRATGKPYRSVTSNPAMTWSRARSPRWKMTRRPSRVGQYYAGPGSSMRKWRHAADRLTATFEFTGRANRVAARTFGVI